MNLLIKNIKQLVTVSAAGKRFKAGPEMNDLGIVENATVLIENGIRSIRSKQNDSLRCPVLSIPTHTRSLPEPVKMNLPCAAPENRTQKSLLPAAVFSVPSLLFVRRQKRN